MSSNVTVDPPVSVIDLLDQTTVFSLLLTVVCVVAAYGLSIAVLAPSTTKKIRFVFIWHLFDALIHFILEGSFLYHSLFSFASPEQLALQPPEVQSLKYRVAGAVFSDAPMAKLWQVYAKADLRWGVGDPTVVALEILTVVVGGSLALWITYLIQRDEAAAVSARGAGFGRLKWFVIVVLATMELYGGFMTFVPEWLIGSPALVTSNWMYKWVYLFFFNTLWVWIPGWLLWEGYWELVAEGASGAGVAAKKRV
ncbi:Emopamil-binding protein [Peziza echinospora]|nr:Emopamil-binding protein [Peziza echinospora]